MGSKRCGLRWMILRRPSMPCELLAFTGEATWRYLASHSRRGRGARVEGAAFMAPVLATFVHAPPRAFAGAPAPAGTAVEVVVVGRRVGAGR